MDEPLKILIVGNIGSGKSSLAHALSEATGFPYISIDDCRRVHSDGSASGEALAWSYFL